MKKCPVCNKETVEQYKPFCSGRCADVDLHRWMGEVYRVPVRDTETDDDLENLAEKETADKLN